MYRTYSYKELLNEVKLLKALHMISDLYVAYYGEEESSTFYVEMYSTDYLKGNLPCLTLNVKGNSTVFEAMLYKICFELGIEWFEKRRGFEKPIALIKEHREDNDPEGLRPTFKVRHPENSSFVFSHTSLVHVENVMHKQECRTRVQFWGE